MNATIESVLDATEIEAGPFLRSDMPSQLVEPQHEPMTQRRVLALATPIIGENLLQTMVAAVDTFMVARRSGHRVRDRLLHHLDPLRHRYWRHGARLPGHRRRRAPSRQSPGAAGHRL